MEIGGDDGDAVVVLTGGMALDGDLRVAGGRQLERETHIAAGSGKVATDDNDLRMAVGTQHVVEECVAAMQGVTKDEDTFGMSQYFCCAIPRGDILS